MFLIGTAPTAGTADAVRNDQWVRLIPPGLTDADARIGKWIDELLSETIQDVLRSIDTKLDAVDLLCYTGGAQREYLLRACTPSRIAPSAVASSVSIEDFETVYSEATEPNALTKRFGKQLADRLPTRFGVEIVQVDTTPLGRTPTLTTRLLASSTSPLAISQDSPHGGLAIYLDALTEQQIPHVSRTIIAPAGPDTYHIEQQVGQFDPAARSLSRADLAEHMRNETGPALATQYDTDAVTSTWEQLRDEKWEIKEPLRQPRCRPTLRRQNRDDDAAIALYKLCTRNTDYQRLLGTLGDVSPLARRYGRLEQTPTLEVTANSLSAMLGLVWRRHFRCWETQDDCPRRPPILEPLALIRSPRGTDPTDGHNPRVPVGNESATELWVPEQATVDDWPRFTSTPSPTPGPQGDTGSRAMRRLCEYGASIGTPSEASTGRPGEPFATTPWVSAIHEAVHGNPSALVIDSSGDIPPGELIAAASHGAPTHTITVVTETESAAERAATILQTPFIDVDGSETVLYHRNACHWLTEKFVVAVPHSASVRWTIDPSGTVRLYINDELAAKGDVYDGSLGLISSAADLATPMWIIDPGPPATVYGLDGEVYDRVADKDAVATQYRSIPLPAVPGARWWTARATCIVLGADGPYVYDPLRTFDLSTDECKMAIKRLFEAHTRPIDQTLEATTIGTAFSKYLYPQTVNSYITYLTVSKVLDALPRKVTGRTEFKSAIQRRPRFMTLTRRNWSYPEASAQRLGAPFSDNTATETPVALFAQSLAVDTPD